MCEHVLSHFALPIHGEGGPSAEQMVGGALRGWQKALDRNGFRWKRHSDLSFCFIAIFKAKTAYTFGYAELRFAISL